MNARHPALLAAMVLAMFAPVLQSVAATPVPVEISGGMIVAEVLAQEGSKRFSASAPDLALLLLHRPVPVPHRPVALVAPGDRDNASTLQVIAGDGIDSGTGGGALVLRQMFRDLTDGDPAARGNPF